jgi:hypothetical protein
MSPKLIKAYEIMVGDVIGIVANQKIEISEQIQTDTALEVSNFNGYVKVRIPDGSNLRFKPDDGIWLFVRPLHNWPIKPGNIVPMPVIDDYEVKIVFNDGTKTALYFKELDFISDLGWTNVDRIVITARWRNNV